MRWWINGYFNVLGFLQPGVEPITAPQYVGASVLVYMVDFTIHLI